MGVRETEKCIRDKMHNDNLQQFYVWKQLIIFIKEVCKTYQELREPSEFVST